MNKEEMVVWRWEKEKGRVYLKYVKNKPFQCILLPMTETKCHLANSLVINVSILIDF